MLSKPATLLANNLNLKGFLLPLACLVRYEKQSIKFASAGGASMVTVRRLSTLQESEETVSSDSFPPTNAQSPTPMPAAITVRDPTQWRESAVLVGRKLTEEGAMKQYKLTPEDLLPLESTRILYKKSSGRTVYLHPERDIELLAWHKYGGPEGFEAALSQMREEHAEWNSNNALPSRTVFDQPEQYRHLYIPLSARDRYDPWTCAESLRHLKKEFSKEKLTWMWKECNTHLDKYPETERLYGVLKALRTFYYYPTRPKKPDVPKSPEFTDLKKILLQAPKYIESKGENQPGLCRFVVPEVGFTKFTWGDEYLDCLYDALLKVLATHGKPSWTSSLRWLVRDAFSSRVEGPAHHFMPDHPEWGLIWLDYSEHWMWGSVSTPEHLRAARRDIGLGPRFNDMLPLTSLRFPRLLPDCGRFKYYSH